MTREEAKKIIEALLFVSQGPLTLERIEEVLEGFNKESIKSIIDEIKEDYNKSNRSFSIVEVAGGFQILTDPFYAVWIRKLFLKERRKTLTTPSLETLSIIAYKQPVTRAEIEAIRGVNIEGVLDTLLERDLIRIAGRKDVIGRPFLYGTTRDFLTHFGLNSLEDLPKLREFSESDIQLGRDELIKKESEGVHEKEGKEIKEVTQKD